MNTEYSPLCSAALLLHCDFILAAFVACSKLNRNIKGPIKGMCPWSPDMSTDGTYRNADWCIILAIQTVVVMWGQVWKYNTFPNSLPYLSPWHQDRHWPNLYSTHQNRGSVRYLLKKVSLFSWYLPSASIVPWDVIISAFSNSSYFCTPFSKMFHVLTNARGFPLLLYRRYSRSQNIYTACSWCMVARSARLLSTTALSILSGRRKVL